MLEIPTIDKKILKILEKTNKPLSKTEIAHRLKISPATISKYVDILNVEKKVKVTRYGNIHLVEMGE